MKFVINDLEWEMEFGDAESIHLNKGNSIFLGLTEYVEQTITIRTGMSEQLTRSTVIHELCHCFLFSLGLCADEYSEEAVCNLFGSHAERILTLTNAFMKGE